MNTIPWTKQAYWSLIFVEPIARLINHGYREETTLTKFHIKRSKYVVSDEDARLFEDELTKYNETLEEPLHNIKFVLSTSNKLAERVFGTFVFTFGTDFQFPIRSLVQSPAEFRQHINEIVQGATGAGFAATDARLLTDDSIRPAILSELARRFVYRRCIQTAHQYTFFTMPMVLWVGCVSVCYSLYYVGSKLLGPIAALIPATAVAVGAWRLIMQLFESSRDAYFDQKVYLIDDSYAQGCIEFCKASLNFGLLMNRIHKSERGHPFALDGNPTDGSTNYSRRLDAVTRYLERKQVTERKSAYRALSRT